MVTVTGQGDNPIHKYMWLFCDILVSQYFTTDHQSPLYHQLGLEMILLMINLSLWDFCKLKNLILEEVRMSQKFTLILNNASLDKIASTNFHYTNIVGYTTLNTPFATIPQNHKHVYTYIYICTSSYPFSQRLLNAWAWDVSCSTFQDEGLNKNIEVTRWSDLA